jgi:surface antigen
MIAVLAISISGCSLSKGVGSLASEPELITGSVTKSVEAEGIDPTDAEAIKLTVVDNGNIDGGGAADSNLLAWSNPETGNSGTITAIDKFIGTHGQSCKKFRTTVDSFMGISLYNGETCELKPGFWVLSWFIRDQGA